MKTLLMGLLLIGATSAYSKSINHQNSRCIIFGSNLKNLTALSKLPEKPTLAECALAANRLAEKEVSINFQDQLLQTGFLSTTVHASYNLKGLKHRERKEQTEETRRFTEDGEYPNLVSFDQDKKQAIMQFEMKEPKEEVNTSERKNKEINQEDGTHNNQTSSVIIE